MMLHVSRKTTISVYKLLRLKQTNILLLTNYCVRSFTLIGARLLSNNVFLLYLQLSSVFQMVVLDVKAIVAKLVMDKG